MRRIGFLIFMVAACSPSSISRIGPTVPRRPADCDVAILEKGETPPRPYRDVGVVALDNCQDYRSLPCRKWLEEAVCELGGHVAYLPEEGGPKREFGPVTFRIIAAAYIAALPYDFEDSPVYKSRTCKPQCKSDEACVDGACQKTVAADCQGQVEKEPAEKTQDDFKGGRCTE